MESKEDRPSQDQLRSLFSDYLSGKRKVEPAPSSPQARKPRPPRPARPSKGPRPAPVRKEIEALPANLNPAQLAKLKSVKSALPLPKYKRIVQFPELAKDPAAFFGRWDRLINGYGMRGAAAVLLEEIKPEDACVLRLTQLLRCDTKEAKRLVLAPQFAGLPCERRAISIRDKLAQLSRRWDSPIESVARVLTGELSESEAAVGLLSRKLRIDGAAAKALLARQEPGEPVPRALELVKKIQQEAARRQAAIAPVVEGILEEMKAEESSRRWAAQALSIPEDSAVKLCGRPALQALPAGERGARVVAEVKGLCAEIGCSIDQACRFLLGGLPSSELDEIISGAVAAGLGLEPAAVFELGRHPESAAAPVRERAKKMIRRVQLEAERLRCTISEAAALLSGAAAPGTLAHIVRGRLGLAEEAAEALRDWIGRQSGAPADAVAAAVERVEEAKASAACSIDQAALLVCGKLTLSDIRAAQLSGELGLSPEPARKLAAWMEAEKVSEMDAKARLRNLRSWAAETMDQACRMLLKEIPTPTKSGTDVTPISGAWE